MATVVPILTVATRSVGIHSPGFSAIRAADAGDGGVAEFGPVLGEELGRGQAAVGIARHDIGEGATAIDPEVPSAGSRCRHLVNIPEVMSCGSASGEGL